MASATSEITWAVLLLQELGVHNLSSITLHYDNQSANHIAKSHVFYEHTKYIEVDY